VGQFRNAPFRAASELTTQFLILIHHHHSLDPSSTSTSIISYDTPNHIFFGFCDCRRLSDSDSRPLPRWCNVTREPEQIKMNHKEWEGDFDPMADPEEQRHILSVLDSFR
jgi:hypothetical protein